jgi:hypothetical protein
MDTYLSLCVTSAEPSINFIYMLPYNLARFVLSTFSRIYSTFWPRDTIKVFVSRSFKRDVASFPLVVFPQGHT